MFDMSFSIFHSNFFRFLLQQVLRSVLFASLIFGFPESLQPFVQKQNSYIHCIVGRWGHDAEKKNLFISLKLFF
jgi:hypothetical protein